MTKLITFKVLNVKMYHLWPVFQFIDNICKEKAKYGFPRDTFPLVVRL